MYISLSNRKSFSVPNHVFVDFSVFLHKLFSSCCFPLKSSMSTHSPKKRRNCKNDNGATNDEKNGFGILYFFFDTFFSFLFVRVTSLGLCLLTCAIPFDWLLITFCLTFFFFTFLVCGFASLFSFSHDKSEFEDIA